MKKHRKAMNKTTRTTAVVAPDEPLFDATFKSSYQDDPISNLKEERVSFTHVGSPLGDAEVFDMFLFGLRDREPETWDRAARSRFATDEYNGFDDPEDDWN